MTTNVYSSVSNASDTNYHHSNAQLYIVFPGNISKVKPTKLFPQASLELGAFLPNDALPHLFPAFRRMAEHLAATSRRIMKACLL